MPIGIGVHGGFRRGRLEPRSWFGEVKAVSDLFMLFDPSQGTYSDTSGTTPSTDGGAVARWNGQAGSEFGSNSTVAQQLVKVASFSGFGNRPAVKDTGGAVKQLTLSVDTTTQVSSTFFIVLHRASASTTAGYVFDFSGGDRTILAHQDGNATGKTGYFNGAWQATAAAVQGAQLLTFVFNAAGNTGKVYRDGKLLSTGTFAAARRIKDGTLGNVNTGDTHYGPLIGYKRALTDAERTRIERALKRDWFPGAPLHLLANGQSNTTTGSGNSSYSGSDLLAWHDGNTAWQQAQTGQSGGMSVRVGTGYWLGRLARNLLHRYPGRTAYVTNTGFPGKAISYFLPDSADVALIYGTTEDPSARNNYDMTRGHWTSGKLEPNVILYAQGEQDGGRSQEDYYADLETLIDAWVADYPNLEKVILFKTAVGACSVTTTGVRAAQEQIASERSYVYLVDLDDLTGDATYHDGCHYTEAGYNAFADRALALL